METKLDKLLQSIDPAITLDQVSDRADDAINTFDLPSGIIEKWDEFKDILTRFHWHVQKTIVRIQLLKSPNHDIEWGRCCELLLKEYGENGEKAAFEMTRTAAEGGIYRVLKALASRMVDEYAGNEIKAKINHFWIALSLDEQWEVMDEYLEKFGYLLTSEITEGSAARIKADFPKALQEHPYTIRRLRKIGRGK